MAAPWLRARRVLHVDVTAFCVAVERVVEPRLRGWPALVAPLTSPRAATPWVNRGGVGVGYSTMPVCSTSRANEAPSARICAHSGPV